MEKLKPVKVVNFTDLDAWQAGHALVLNVYKITSRFPAPETYSLTGQLRRAIVSVTSNLAEGFSRNTRGDKVRFYTIALGSLIEVENQLIICRDVGYINIKEYEDILLQVKSVQKLTSGLIRTARNWGEPS